MNLEVTNIGKISHANIELNSITVIAGENNTGKSTIGKMLFCVFHAFHGIEEQVVAERVKSIARILRGYLYESYSGRFLQPKVIMRLAENIVNRKEAVLADMNVLAREIVAFLQSIDLRSQQHISIENLETLEPLYAKICVYLTIEDDDLRKAILRKRLEAEFAMKIGHLNHPDKESRVGVHIKDSSIEFTVIKNENIDIKSYMSLNKEIIYMDDPFILDDINDSRWDVFLNKFGHRHDMLEKLADGKKTTEFTMADELVVKKKLEKIFDIMSGVCSGSVTEDESGNFIYQTDRLQGNLEMINLSTGMKSFAILRRLLENGNIDEKGVVILDEPEIHLHPEWQLRFAEIIVLIQKEFDVNILLNTHSPYFLNAIEVYSEKYGIDQKCKYYLVDEKEGSTAVTDVTDKTEIIYAKLARPLQELENLEYSDEGTV
ncbi:MAG: ATP-binding protein [Lachnospiraceae bacterium]|nr:ATP-binding protein [Lachnospiraceae bacterium]